MSDRALPIGGGPLTVLRDAALAVVVAAAVAFGVNAARRHGLALVARTPYDILKPCPVREGRVEDMQPADPRLRARGTLVIDAREVDEYARWHLEGARSIPYDFLRQTDAKRVREVLASGASLAVVYGDGADPDTGHELASDLALGGVRNVYRVVGGAPALGGPPSEDAP